MKCQLGLRSTAHTWIRELDEINYFDAGDIPLPFGNAEKSLDLIEEFVDQVLADDKFPLGMGGEHLVTWPVIKAMYKKYPRSRYYPYGRSYGFTRRL